MALIKKAVFVGLLASAALSLATDCVPTKQRTNIRTESPNARYRVLKALCSNSPRNALILLEVSSGVQREIYRYARDANVLWSPDSKWIAINDYAGSDYTNNIVIAVDGDVPPINLKELIIRSKPKPDFLESDHVYLSAQNWKSDSEVELIIWGHDSMQKKSFCQCFLTSLEGQIQQCRLDTEGNDPEEYCDKIKK